MEGELSTLKKLVQEKFNKNDSVFVIAEELEEDEKAI